MRNRRPGPRKGGEFCGPGGVLNPSVSPQYDKCARKVCVLCDKSVTAQGTGKIEAVNGVLLIEDDDQIRIALSLALEDEGYVVLTAADGESGLAQFGSNQPDVVLLDLRLPDISGFEVCRRIRLLSNVPIIMVTAQTDTHDVVAGLEAGADDYVTKPVVPKELAARIRAALRRSSVSNAATDDRPPARDQFAGIEIHRELFKVTKDGNELPLTRTEYNLLCEFADHPGQVLSRQQLLERVWGYEYLGDGRLVDAHVRRLRVKIETIPDEPTIVVTVRGIGYRLNA